MPLVLSNVAQLTPGGAKPMPAAIWTALARLFKQHEFDHVYLERVSGPIRVRNTGQRLFVSHTHRITLVSMQYEKLSKFDLDSHQRSISGRVSSIFDGA